MSFPVHKTTPANPATSPTAAMTTTTTTSSVYEYICLFTHDLKRKAKRWKDGRLRYHVFNDRLMVYDEHGGVVGDAHLPGRGELHEGDEVTLDRGTAIVQVCERVGETTVDLAELVDKRAREVDKRRREAAAKQQQASSRAQQAPQARQAQGEGRGSTHSQSLQRPLGALMQTPGRIGRAVVPRESPYEQRLQRQKEEQQEDTPPPSKRQKRSVSPPSKMGHARSLFGTQLTLSTRPMSSWSQRRHALRDRTNMRLHPTPSREVDGEEESGLIVEDEPPKSPRGRHHNFPTKDLGSRISKPSPVERGSVEEDGDKDLIMHDAVSEPQATAEPRVPDVGYSRIEPLQQHQGLNQRKSQPKLSKAGPQRRQPPKPMAARFDEDDAMPENSSKTRIEGPRIPETSAEGKGGGKLDCEDTRGVAPKGKQTSMDASTGVADGRAKPAAVDHRHSPASESGNAASDSAAPKDAQPRTELRIKARKKRGLLMLSEEKQPRIEEVKPPIEPETNPLLPVAEAESDGFEEWYCEGSSVTGLGNSAGDSSPHDLAAPREGQYRERVTRAVGRSPGSDGSRRSTQDLALPAAGESRTSRSRRSVGGRIKGGEEDYVSQTKGIHQSLEPNPPPDTSHAAAGVSDDSSEDDAPRTRPRRNEKGIVMHGPDTAKSMLLECGNDGSQSEDDWAGPTPRSKQTNNKTKAKPKTVDKKQTTTGPRISRISKSAKSKEIFGFRLPEGESIIPDALASATGRVGWVPDADQPSPEPSPEQRSNGKHGQEETLGDEKTQQLGPRANQGECNEGPSRLATSPSKARLANPATRGRKAADKADAAGQIPQSVVPFDPAPASTRPVETKATTAKTTKTLRGFSKANGGAWSRHAGDLLGMERPGG